MLTKTFARLIFLLLLCAAVLPATAQQAAGITEDPCADEKPPQQFSDRTQRRDYLLQRDFGQLCKYRAANTTLTNQGGQSPRVVFMGDSITELWGKIDASFFAPGVIDRGISGQTTSQMMLRFRQDVIDLHPATVHIMGGTNDVAGNTGPSTLQQVEGNLATMAELARVHGIRVILASVPPVAKFPWRATLKTGSTIPQLNAWIKNYASRHGFVYVDYYAALASPGGGMQPGMSIDGVHPTLQGYRVMEPLTLAAIKQALSTSPAKAGMP